MFEQFTDDKRICYGYTPEVQRIWRHDTSLSSFLRSSIRGECISNVSRFKTIAEWSRSDIAFPLPCHLSTPTLDDWSLGREFQRILVKEAAARSFLDWDEPEIIWDEMEKL